MEDLCNQMSGMIPVHDPQNEYEMLEVSKTMSLLSLSKSTFLMKTFNRYRRYLTYIDFQGKGYNGELILILLNDFLSFENVDNINWLVLAAKCSSIDRLILDLVISPDYESEKEEYDDY